MMRESEVRARAPAKAFCVSLSLLFAALTAASTACSFFPAGGYYTRAIARAPVDPNSANYIASMVESGNVDGFWAAPTPVEFINIARDTTPRRRVRQKVAYHDFDRPYPWSDDFRIEPLGDGHAIVIDERSCELYEAYNATFAGGELSAYSGAQWNLHRPFVPLPAGWPSAMASGLSLYAGMIRWEEVARGAVDHALNWGPPRGTVAQYTFVRPASATDQLPYTGPSRYQLPYGAHLRLRANFDLSHFGPQSRAIAQAMKTYGVYLADTGTKGNALYNAMPLDGVNRWDARDLASLAQIHIRDFELLTLGRIERVPGH